MSELEPVSQELGVVYSEFAQVRVEIDDLGNGPRLKLTDLKTDQVRYLDALELETIVWLRQGFLWQILDPSADRWREDADEVGGQ
jgi:hypothetical protein